MTNLRLSLSLVILAIALILLSSAASAYGYASPQSKYSTSYGGTAKYYESPGYSKYPIEKATQSRGSRASGSNFDSTNTGYESRGPMIERRIIYSESFLEKNKDKTVPFYSSSRNKVIYNVRNEVIEKYVGASESAYTTSQNKRIYASEEQGNANYDYDGGFSFGKQRMYDASEYGSNSYTEPYYYRPMFGSRQGHYNWRY